MKKIDRDYAYFDRTRYIISYACKALARFLFGLITKPAFVNVYVYLTLNRILFVSQDRVVIVISFPNF